MKVNREEFIRVLESVKPGCSATAILEQSDCFIFRKGWVKSYNEETCCARPSGLDKSFIGAVPAVKLLEILEKLPEEEIDIDFTDNKMVLGGKGGRKSRLRLEKEINLDMGQVEKAEEWKSLPVDFADAVNLVGLCTGSGKDITIEATCVHIHPDYLEAADKVQFCRWELKTGVSTPILIRHDSIKHVAGLGMTEFSETDAWIHFRNPEGLRMSCRRYQGEYPDFSEGLHAEGDSMALPLGLAEAAGRCSVFSKENSKDGDFVQVNMSPGKMWVIGTGISGEHEEPKKCSYKGSPISFLISPKLLSDLVKRHKECIVTPDKLFVRSSNQFTYVICLKESGEAKIEEEVSTEGGEE